MKTKKKISVIIFVRNAFLTVFILGIVAAGSVAFRGYCMYAAALDRLPTAEAAREIRAGRGFTSISDLPDTYLKAVVCAEDNRFYEHNGVDLVSIGRAFLRNIQSMSIVEGGSTITQQLAKNLYFTGEQELSRKAAEMFMAWKLESDFSKDEILELYVNCIYFGSGCYSVGDASRCYFDKDPLDMSDWECTMLAGIPNAPSVYDLNVNPDLAMQRQRQVVNMMVRQNGLTESQAQVILDTPPLGVEKEDALLCAKN